VERLEESNAALRDAIRLAPHFYMAHCQLGFNLSIQGRFREGLETFRRGYDLVSGDPARRAPLTPLLALLERRVAVHERLPAVLRGDDEPASPGEWIEFGDVCLLSNRCLASARFFAGGFSRDPGLLTTKNAYNAACAAALCGTGQGRDAPDLDEEERTRWRRQAREWLAQALGLGREDVSAAIRHHRALASRDSDLAGVRDEAELAKLPPDEQKAWRKLWTEVRQEIAEADAE
jgi:hypothetical protein